MRCDKPMVRALVGGDTCAERQGCSSTKSVHSLIDIFHTVTASSQELSSQPRYLSKWQTAGRGCDKDLSPPATLSETLMTDANHLEPN